MPRPPIIAAPAVVLALALCAALPAGAAARPQTEPGADHAHGGPRTVRVIVSLSRSSGWPGAALRRRYGFRVESRLRVIHALAGRVSARELSALRHARGVDRVERDRPVITFGTDTAAFGRTDQQAFGVTAARSAVPVGLDGTGHTAAVIDSGIDAAHEELDGGKVIGFADCLSGVCQAGTPSDDFGHGTWVSDILAGDRGVAPGAKLVGVKVLDGGGGPADGAAARFVAAIQWVIDHREDYSPHIDVLNMSIGIGAGPPPYGNGCSDGEDALSRAANAAVEAGIVVVAAAGNDGPAPCTVGAPAAAARVLTVGNMGGLGDTWDGGQLPILGFRLDPYSSRGPTAAPASGGAGRTKPDLVAPGVGVNAAWPTATDGYKEGSGTSAAAPFAAGVALLLEQAAPSLTPAQVGADLTSTAQDWGPPGPDDDYGAGRLDAYAAVRAAGASVADEPTSPRHDHVTGSVAAGGTVTYPVPVGDTALPVAATLLVRSWPAPDRPDLRPNLDLVLRDPSGAEVASARNVPSTAAGAVAGPANGREETLGYRPPASGTYTLEVASASGGASYDLDVSRPAALPTAGSEPSITGTPHVGVPLTVAPVAWTALLPLTGQTLQWESCGRSTCTPVAGANASSYTPTAADLGRSLRIRAMATDADGTGVTVSAETNTVAAGTLVSRSTPSISGAARAGATLTADPGTWSPAPATTVAEWQRCRGTSCATVSGARGWSYAVTDADVGFRLRVVETATRPGYADAQAESAPSSAVAAETGTGSPVGSTAPAAMSLLSPPQTRGTPAVGATVRVTPATWAPAPAGRQRQWLRCERTGDACAAIPGATTARLHVPPGFAGAVLRVQETVSAPGRLDATTLSPPGRPVAAGLRRVGGPGPDVLAGDWGADVLSGAGGADRLSGGSGRDRLTGGPGADVLRGGRGADRLRGGAGADRLLGGPGADVLLARDRRRDVVSCGAGPDRVQADTVDVIRSDCEQVRRR